MNCEEISELLSAYALGVLDRDDLEAVEAHLRDGREHDDDLVELRATVFAMDRYGDQRLPEPSVDLAGRVRLLVEPDSTREAPETVRTRAFAIPTGWGAIAAAVALLLIFGAGWVAGRTFGGDGDQFAYLIQGIDGQVVEVTGTSAADNVTVTMAGIDQLPGESSYQLWAVREDGWVSIGVCNTNENGWWRGDFAFSFQLGEEIALTVEPAGGSQAPTSEPVLRSEF